ncbi:tetratricopeptide repeat protein [Donghicola sp. XS_ASV15]|uniref:tetratricopeptide repeat protein n=1 Tax=Donghicola sp. XS_ASV15 TaxID=3241295 RepID=UPI00351210AB
MTRLFFVIALTLSLAACDSSEERAEGHFQNALALLDDGDTDRALIELRNVLKLNTAHLTGRRLYADLVTEQGRLAEGLSQYMRLAEQAPDDAETSLIIARMLMKTSYADAKPYADKAVKGLPTSSEAKALQAAATYYTATKAKDSAQAQSAATQAKEVLSQDPTQQPARQVGMAELIKEQRWTALLEQADIALGFDPASLPMYRAKLMALERIGDLTGVESTLRKMTKVFPEERGLGIKLVNWYTRQGRTDDAEAWLRQQIGNDASDRELLLAYIRQTRGDTAALEELDRAFAAEPLPADLAESPLSFDALRAALRYELGDKERAIADLKAMLKDAESSESIDRVRMALASILAEEGYRADAEILVNETLAHDPAQTDALRLQGAWMISDDQTGDAILVLRKALDQEPDNAMVLATLARAYEREGSSDLMSDVLMRAVEAAQYDGTLSLRMISVLREQEQFAAAEELTIEALRRQNTDIRLLGTLAEIHMSMEDWGRVTQDIQRLRALGSEESVALANELEGKHLALRRKTEELKSFVETQLKEDSSGTAMVVRGLILNGQMAEAAEYARSAHTKSPEDPVAKFLYAMTLGHTGEDAKAIKLFQELVAADPLLRDSWMAIYNLQQRAGQMDDALATLDQAQEHLQGDPGLQWIRASHVQALGDFDQAIAIYEELYAQDSEQDLIANNLASLLSTVRSDEDSLSRAYIIARRLQGSDVPAFRDTYGWIALQRGEVETALDHLEPAATALSEDPSVQYHLGMAYLANGQESLAHTTLLNASDLLVQHQDALPALRVSINEALAMLAEPVPAAVID